MNWIYHFGGIKKYDWVLSNEMLLYAYCEYTSIYYVDIIVRTNAIKYFQVFVKEPNPKNVQLVWKSRNHEFCLVYHYVLLTY